MYHDPDKFNQLKSNLELGDSFSELIQQKHNAVRQYLGNNLQGLRDTKLIGSVARKTRIQPRPNDSFDIDILVVLGQFDMWVSSGGITPGLALNAVRSSLATSPRYQTMGPAVDSPTIIFEYRDGVKVELVPAYLDNIGHSPDGRIHSPKGRSFWIPKATYWELSDYDHEADYISAQNRAADRWLIPTIKKLKAIRREHFPQLRPFHLEILAASTIPAAVNHLKSQGSKISSPILLTYFFSLAGDMLNQPAVMSGSNSSPVILDPVSARNVSIQFGNLRNIFGQTMNLPSQSDRTQVWRTIFGEPFPAT